VASAVRERFGVQFQTVPLVAELIIDTLMLAAEIGGVALAIQLLTGVGFTWWVLPIAAVAWLMLWCAGFSTIEYGLGLLGLVTLCFVVAAWRTHPSVPDLVRALRPSRPRHDHLRYAYLAVSIMGATVSPYLLNFYASGAIEEKLTERELWINRTTAYAGMLFGGVVSMGVLVTSAMVLAPRPNHADTYSQAALMFVPVFGRWGITLFAAALGIGCFGAAVEIALNSGYLFAQVFGWTWGANKRRRDVARFTAAFTITLLGATLVALTGIDPLNLTLLAVALTVVIMPLVILPFLVLMNDPRFVKRHTSGPIGNALLATLTVMAALFALIVIPLEILGG
jgi:Mn2+/Fe2+ NRAMP family transporter